MTADQGFWDSLMRQGGFRRKGSLPLSDHHLDSSLQIERRASYELGPDTSVPALVKPSASDDGDDSSSADLALLADGLPQQRPAGDHLGEEGQSSSFAALANLFIAFVGTGVLGLPYAFARTGYLFGALFLSVIGALSLHSTLMMVQCKRSLEDRGIVSLSQVVRHCLGPWGQAAIEIAICLSQSGFCVAYLLFTGQNFAKLSDRDAYIFILLALAILLPLMWPKGIGTLGGLSIAADVLKIAAILSFFYEVIRSLTTTQPPVEPYQSISAVPFIFGVANYSYEGMGVILPVERSMRKRERFTLVVTTNIVVVTVLYVAFGLVGYLAFGSETMEIVTLNLPPSAVTVAVYLLFSLAAIATFPVQMMPVWEAMQQAIVSNAAFRASSFYPRRWLVFRGLRVAVTCAIAGVAIIVPGFAAFISLIGSMCCAIMTFIIPGLCHLVLFRKDMSKWHIGYDVFMVLLGLVGGLLGTGDSVAAFVKLYQHKGP